MKIIKKKVKLDLAQRAAVQKLIADMYRNSATKNLDILQQMVFATRNKEVYGFRLFIKHYRLYAATKNGAFPFALYQKRRHEVDEHAELLLSNGGVSKLVIEFTDGTTVDIQSICQYSEVFNKKTSREVLLDNFKRLVKCAECKTLNYINFPLIDAAIKKNV